MSEGRKRAMAALIGVLVGVVLYVAWMGAAWWADPARGVEDPYERLALAIERAHPWVDVISLGKSDQAVWCYVDVGPWYADPTDPRYNIFAVAGDVVAALEQIVDETTRYVFIGHMRWEPDAHDGEGRYAIRQPWWGGPSWLRSWGALYPCCPTTWWVSGYLSPDSYRWIGNPYAAWWARLLCCAWWPRN